MMTKKGQVIFITGIDTDIGKTVVTGLLGRYLKDRGYKVITQKLCQTGCRGISDDIRTHREIMGTPLTEVDLSGLTCPYVFSKPCSPHLAASLDNSSIDVDRITEATCKLQGMYDYVIVEGVGGLMVPLTTECTLADYLRNYDYHHILVSCSRLGSINHTLSALEIMQQRKLNLLGIVYNRYMDSDKIIANDSAEIFRLYLKKYGFTDTVVDMAPYSIESDYQSQKNSQQCIDFSNLINRLQ